MMGMTFYSLRLGGETTQIHLLEVAKDRNTTPLLGTIRQFGELLETQTRLESKSIRGSRTRYGTRRRAKRVASMVLMALNFYWVILTRPLRKYMLNWIFNDSSISLRTRDKPRLRVS